MQQLAEAGAEVEANGRRPPLRLHYPTFMGLRVDTDKVRMPFGSDVEAQGREVPLKRTLDEPLVREVSTKQIVRRTAHFPGLLLLWPPPESRSRRGRTGRRGR